MDYAVLSYELPLSIIVFDFFVKYFVSVDTAFLDWIRLPRLDLLGNIFDIMLRWRVLILPIQQQGIDFQNLKRIGSPINYGSKVQD
jgi:hypothetical protein